MVGSGVQRSVTRITAALASPLTGLATTLPLDITSKYYDSRKMNDHCNARRHHWLDWLRHHITNHRIRYIDQIRSRKDKKTGDHCKPVVTNDLSSLRVTLWHYDCRHLHTISSSLVSPLSKHSMHFFEEEQCFERIRRSLVDWTHSTRHILDGTKSKDHVWKGLQLGAAPAMHFSPRKQAAIAHCVAKAALAHRMQMHAVTNVQTTCCFSRTFRSWSLPSSKASSSLKHTSKSKAYQWVNTITYLGHSWMKATLSDTDSASY